MFGYVEVWENDPSSFACDLSKHFPNKFTVSVSSSKSYQIKTMFIL